MQDVQISARSNSTNLSLGREHYQGLDFLRGIAAFVVVLFHFSSRLDLAGLFHHGYLAVDLFFALSGYVVDRAYGRRLAARALSLQSFFALRVLRLFPMLLFGMVLAAAVDVFRPGDFKTSVHVFDIVVTGVLGCLLLPTLWKTTLEDTTYPLNGPTWSLFFELVANVLHALCIRTGNVRAMLVVLLPCSLVGLVWGTLHEHSIEVGTHRATFLLGLPRVFWSYTLGVLLSRSDLRFFPALNKWLYAAVVFCVLACPELPGRFNWMFDIVVILLVVPLVIAGAARCSDAQSDSSLSRWCGDMSYPLYMIHYPIVRAVAVVSRSFAFSAAVNLSISVLVTVLLSFAAITLFRVYDAPVRRWLSRRPTVRSLLSG